MSVIANLWRLARTAATSAALTAEASLPHAPRSHVTSSATSSSDIRSA